MNPEQFAQLAEEGFNRIPVVFETLADLDTPLSTYLKLAKGPYSYLPAETLRKHGLSRSIGSPQISRHSKDIVVADLF